MLMYRRCHSYILDIQSFRKTDCDVDHCLVVAEVRERLSVTKQETQKFDILLTVHPNIIIVFFTNLMDKFFILIHLLHSSTCFEHYYAHPQEVKLY